MVSVTNHGPNRESLRKLAYIGILAHGTSDDEKRGVFHHLRNAFGI